MSCNSTSSSIPYVQHSNLACNSPAINALRHSITNLVWAKVKCEIDKVLDSIIAGNDISIDRDIINNTVTVNAESCDILGRIEAGTGINIEDSTEEGKCIKIESNAVPVGLPSGDCYSEYLYWGGDGPTSEWKVGGSGPGGSIPNDMYRIHIGCDAGLTSQGDSSVAIGHEAGKNTQNLNCIAIGVKSGEVSQGITDETTSGTNAISIGTSAGQFSQRGGSIAIGVDAGMNSQLGSAVAIGNVAGKNTQGAGSIAIGDNAGTLTQSNSCIAIGEFAGNDRQGITGGAGGIPGQSIAIGGNAGGAEQRALGIAIGSEAGRYNQNIGSIAIGTKAGIGISGMTQGASAIAIGSDSGKEQALSSIAIGTNAGQKQSVSCISIGDNSGRTQLASSIALGSGAGFSQQVNAIAIGYRAGGSNQGTNSISIGTFDPTSAQSAYSIVLNSSTQAQTESTGSNSIVINADNTAPLSNSMSGVTKIAPIRGISQSTIDSDTDYRPMYYHAVTKELVYSTG